MFLELLQSVDFSKLQNITNVVTRNSFQHESANTHCLNKYVLNTESSQPYSVHSSTMSGMSRKSARTRISETLSTVNSCMITLSYSKHGNPHPRMTRTKDKSFMFLSDKVIPSIFVIGSRREVDLTWPDLTLTIHVSLLFIFWESDPAAVEIIPRESAVWSVRKFRMTEKCLEVTGNGSLPGQISQMTKFSQLRLTN